MKNTSADRNVCIKAPKAGILLCDHTREQLRDRFGDYPEVFTKMLDDFEIESTVYDLTADQFPQDYSEQDVFFITGSKKSCYQQIDWIERLCQLVRDFKTRNIRLVGICFGHQLISHALGGLVEKSQKGWGMGIHTYRLTSIREHFDGRDFFSALVTHQDQVIKPATGATIHASSDFCPHALLSYGDSIISFQGHPELSREYIKAILELRRKEIGEQAYYQGHADMKKSTDNHLLVNGMLKFLGLTG